MHDAWQSHRSGTMTMYNSTNNKSSHVHHVVRGIRCSKSNKKE